MNVINYVWEGPYDPSSNSESLRTSAKLSLAVSVALTALAGVVKFFSLFAFAEGAMVSFITKGAYTTLGALYYGPLYAGAAAFMFKVAVFALIAFAVLRIGAEITDKLGY